MNFKPVEAIADAVLFEGYMLYPYRPSAIKNRQRWNFGTLYPRIYAEAKQEPWKFTTQLLFEAGDSTRLTACIRFLQLIPPPESDPGGWSQGFVRSRKLSDLSLSRLETGVDFAIDLSVLSNCEQRQAPASFRAGELTGRLTLEADRLRQGLFRLTASFRNETPLEAETWEREAVLGRAFTSAHLLLGVEGGEFVSLIETPEPFAAEAKSCAQQGVFPVLAGSPGDHSVVLCSPIILYDYPQVAPESAGDFFDGTEIDELLALRVLTLTDEEKAEARRMDPYARSIVERTERLREDQMLHFHGAVREVLPSKDSTQKGQHGWPSDPHLESAADPGTFPDPFAERPTLDSIRVLGVELRKGDRVRLWPQRRADILDMEVEGKVAVIEAIEQDLENNIHFAVVLEDDPGSDLGLLRQAGHRFFYSPEEIEPLNLEVP